MGQCKKGKNETTQKQHKNSTERRREMGRKVQGKTEHQSITSESFGKGSVICLPLCLYA